jgi:hypothetical protein
VLERNYQVENSFLLFFYPFVQIMFDDSQNYVDLFICLKLVVPSIECLGKFVKSIVKVVIFTKLSPQVEAVSSNVHWKYVIIVPS